MRSLLLCNACMHLLKKTPKAIRFHRRLRVRLSIHRMLTVPQGVLLAPLHHASPSVLHLTPVLTSAFFYCACPLAPWPFGVKSPCVFCEVNGRSTASKSGFHVAISPLMCCQWLLCVELHRNRGIGDRGSEIGSIWIVSFPKFAERNKSWRSG